MRKAQISTELILILSIVFIMFLVILGTIDKRTDEYQYNRRLMDAKKYSEKVATTINMVYLSGAGTSATINMPTTLIDNTNYSINIYPKNHMVEISWMSKIDMRQHHNQIVTANITGNLTGLNGNINITNIDGGIFIEN